VKAQLPFSGPGRRAPRLRSVLGGALAAAVAGAMVAAGSPASAGFAHVGSAAGPHAQATAIAASVPVTPRWTRGVDGHLHVDYDLLITNWVPGTVLPRSVQVLGPRGAVLLTMAGADLAAHTHLLSAIPPVTAIPASASVAVVVDVVLPGRDASLRPSAVPAILTHRIGYQLAADVDPHVRPLISSLRVVGPQTPPARTRPTVISPPLRGPGWTSFVGCCQPSALHRRLLYPANGQWIKPETFAIDWLQFRNGRPFAGDGSKNTQWYDFGTPVRAVADGMVVRAVDGRPDIPPNSSPIMPNADYYSGNYVVVRIHPGVYAQYAHLKEGSVTVHAGQQVRAGQQLGNLGDSGNSTAPHLHFGLISGPDFTVANSLPWVFDQFTFTGYLNPDTGDITGTPHPAHRAYPLLDSVSTLP